MSTKENIAIARRVDSLERQINAIEPVRITTSFEVYARGEEPQCSTLEQVRAAARLKPRPKLIAEFPDLDCLIDAETGAHVLRHELDAAELADFDRQAGACERWHQVVITCHEQQLDLIRSCVPLTETQGGARAGKTKVLEAWALRQWLLRGHDADEDHDEPARFWWVIKGKGLLYEYGVKRLLRAWPPVFVGRPPRPSDSEPVLYLLDGSRVEFKHASNTGGAAGTNLRQASVEAIVVDEKSAIHSVENWRELQNRVSQTHGPIATATTPLAGHWTAADADDVSEAGGIIYVRHLDRFCNPWIVMPAHCSDLIREKICTAAEVEAEVLRDPTTGKLRDSEDLADAMREKIRASGNLDAQRAWLGDRVLPGHVLWRNWDERYIVSDEQGLRSHLETPQHGKLPNITAAIVGAKFARRDKARPGLHWIGQDYNVAPCVGVVLQLFGHQHRPSTWHVLVTDEIAVEGPTVTYAAELKKRYPKSAGYGDPRGHMPGRHESHGARSSTDAKELEAAGHYLQPAGGRSKSGRAANLPVLDRLNIMHRLMFDGRFFVHARCAMTRKSMREQQAQPDGRPVKNDLLSGPTDAGGYGIFPVFSHELATQTEFG